MTSAQERGSTTNSLTYAYDRTGNRTDGGKTYDAANQVSGWTYDAAGNLTNDGTTTYAYDALSRLTTRGAVTQAYNGDGTLVAATSGSTTTRYAQDLASPLSQVLQIGTTNYVYGMERLAAQTGSTRTWYGADALGSVRQTLDAAGVPQATTSDDPWGQVQTGSVPTFGFTGELHDGAAGLVNLRARWYNTRAGTFTAVDPFAGFAEQPYSQHPYQYAYSSPTTYTDPTGRSPIYCVPIAVLDSPIPGPADLAAGACFVVVAGVYFVGQMLSPYSSGTTMGPSSPFETGGVPVPVLSAPHGAPQPAPTPVPFSPPPAQARPIAVFPEAPDCPPVVVQPGPVPQQPTPVISANPLPTPGVRGPVVLTAIPSGFRSSEDFAEFGKTLYTGLRAAGFDDAEAFMQGSAVTGGFNVRTSDFDVAVASTEAFVRALDGGLSNYYKRDPERLGPIKVGSAEASALGVETLLLHLSQQYGREVNVMLYPSAAEVYKRRSYPIPDADQ